ASVKLPGRGRRDRGFKIDDGFFVAVKHGFREGMPRLVRHPREMKLRPRLDALSKKAIENRRRRRAVEASVVKTQSNFARIRHSPPSPHPIAKRKSRWKALKDGRV